MPPTIRSRDLRQTPGAWFVFVTGALFIKEFSVHVYVCGGGHHVAAWGWATRGHHIRWKDGANDPVAYGLVCVPALYRVGFAMLRA